MYFIRKEAFLFVYFNLIVQCYSVIQGVQMKGIPNKKMYISETNRHARIWFMSSERKALESFFSCLAYTHVPTGDLR
jgi:hypothetical protein